MIVGRGGVNGEIVAAVPVELRVDPVHGEGHDGQHIGGDGSFGPVGIDFAGGYIFNVVFIRNIIIFCGRIGGSAVVDNDGLRRDDAA